MNLIGKAVVSGGVRRTAEIAFGDPNSDEYLDLKDYKVNPNRRAFGWTSNNSIFAELGMDYAEQAKRTGANGEPGYIWLKNVRTQGRMADPPDNKDHRAMGANPCMEQSLESYELCCLVETFPYKHTDIEDFMRTLKYAYLYAKTVTLGKTHWPETNRVMLRNRRIGCSMSGIVQFISSRGIEEFREWCEKGYHTIKQWDTVYSDWLAVPKSIKKTSIKPSGTVSLLAGATPGVHFPISRFYIRRMRVSGNDPLLAPLKKAGYKIERANEDKSQVVVEFPVDAGDGVRSVSEVSMWEQLNIAAFIQKYWADNQVSCTISFNPLTESTQIEHALHYYQYQLKGISFLPQLNGVYKQMPYEEITEAEYKRRTKHIKSIKFTKASATEAVGDKFCDSDVCELEFIETDSSDS
jgi:adenosylcobalamin-dependent ribonucleoside-triphosphate reductase